MRKAYDFAGYTLDLTRGSLNAGGRVIELRPKSFGLLTYLVENPGRLVPKDELLGAIWPDVTVGDESLAKCISEVRAALNDSAQRLVRTVPRRGYLLDVPVSPCLPPPVASEPAAAAAGGETVVSAHPQPIGMRWRRRVAIPIGAALVVVFGILAAAVSLWHRPADRPFNGPAIAVLPFVNAAGDPRQDYFCDGLTEDLIASLGRFRELFVIGRASTFSYKGRSVPPEQIARELGVRYLLSGSVRRDDETLRINAELIDADTGAQLWAGSYDRTLAGVFAVQDEVTRNIVGALPAHIDRAELERVSRSRTDSPAAYDLYLRGKALITMRHGDNRGAMVAQARQLFDKALEADPRYAPAMQGLAYTYAAAFLEPMQDGLLVNELRQPATLDRALTLARQAVELNPYLAEAHATLAWILHWQYRRGEAIAEFNRALELNPNLADGRLAHMLVHDGRAPEAVAFMRRVMRQDPFPPPIYFSYLGNACYLTGDYDAAFNTLRTGMEKMPGYRAIPVWLAAAAAQSGHDEDAHTTAALVLQLAPKFTIAGWLRHIAFDRQADADHLATGLRKAGLPE
ncbi:MAG TPA: winged helix-turn-helix domain-containing tetratricopeptide repeat protein [Stellaceae bacterium]|nr:winged helix-turn-helix domain-containing tetratricopeptide repeat protein [Stellaceae bacterium]